MDTRLRLGFSELARVTCCGMYVFAIPLAASQHTFRIPLTTTPTPSFQLKDRQGHAVQIADLTRCTWDGPLPRRVGFVQSGHPEACRGCFAAPDCRASLPGCRLWQEGRQFTIALHRFRLPGKVDVLARTVIDQV
jgi:hypothetical protein